MADAGRLMTVNGIGKTERQDAWWLEAVLTVLVLMVFSLYAAWRAIGGVNFEWGPYISPFYSPKVEEWFPFLSGFPFSPAFLTIWIPIGFRGTCYFFRRAYYRAFFMDPPACAVGEPRATCYSGESGLFIFQNIHRYFFYLAAFITIFHLWHGFISFNFNGRFGIGVGSIVMAVDAVLLALYVYSCHSWRHLLAGKLDCFSCGHWNALRHGLWVQQSKLNENHMWFAWVSLATVWFADFYVMMVSSGRWHDLRLF